MATLRRPTPISLTTERPALTDVVQRREVISVTTERPAFNIVMRRPATQSIVTTGCYTLSNVTSGSGAANLSAGMSQSASVQAVILGLANQGFRGAQQSAGAGVSISCSAAQVSGPTRQSAGIAASVPATAMQTAGKPSQAANANVAIMAVVTDRALGASQAAYADSGSEPATNAASQTFGPMQQSARAETLVNAVVESIAAGAIQVASASIAISASAANQSGVSQQVAFGSIELTATAANMTMPGPQAAIATTIVKLDAANLAGGMAQSAGASIPSTVTAAQTGSGNTHTANAQVAVMAQATLLNRGAGQSASSKAIISATSASIGKGMRQAATVSSSPTAWTPANLATVPKAWWDASDAATISLSGSAVTAWANKGSAGGSASQSTSGSRPAYSASSLNSLPGIVFDNDYLTSTISAPGSYTIAAVLATNTGDTGNYVAVVGDSSTLGGLTVFIGSSTVNYFLVDSSDHEWWSDAVTGGAGQVLDMIKNGTTVTSFQNGTASSGTGGNPHQSMNSGDGIAAISIGYSGGTNYRGTIQEIVLLPYAAGTSDRQKLEGYLAWKWARQSSLPSGHPYKSAAPTV